jgi:hypothetical protein
MRNNLGLGLSNPYNAIYANSGDAQVNFYACEFNGTTAGGDGTLTDLTFFDSTAGTEQDEYSLAFWIYLDSTSGALKTVILGQGGASGNSKFGITATGSSGYLYFIGSSDFDSNRYYKRITIGTNEWHHIAFVCSLSGATKISKIYVDCEEFTPDATAYSTLNPINPNQLRVGYASSGFKGKIDQIGFYNKALSSVEIAELCASGVITNGVAKVSDCLQNFDFEAQTGADGTGSNDLSLTATTFVGL